MERRTILGFDFYVEQQCVFGIRAARDIGHCSRQHDIDGIWYSVTALLCATANISKVLWPKKKKYEERGILLRSRFAVTDDSPLKDQEMRHVFEHFDERFEDWATDHPGMGFSHCGVHYDLGDLPAQEQNLRTYTVPTNAVTYLGISREIDPIVAELEKLLSFVEKDIRTLMLDTKNPAM